MGMVDLYQYNYVESNGFQSVTYSIKLMANTVTVKSGKGVGKYEFKYDGSKRRLTLYGDNSVLCEIDKMLAVRSIDRITIEDDKDDDRVIALYLTLIDGKSERVVFPISELVGLYKDGAGISIDDTGTIKVNVREDGLLKFDNDALYVAISGGDGIAIDEDGVITYTGSTASDSYTKDESDEITDGIREEINALSGETAEALDDLDEMIRMTESGLTELGEAVDGIGEEVEYLTSGLTEANEAIAELTEMVDALGVEVSGLTVSADTLAEEIRAINEGLTETGSTITDIIDDLNGINEVVTGNTEAIDKLMVFSGKTDNAISELTDLIEEVSGNTLDAATGYTDAVEHSLKDFFAMEYAPTGYVEEVASRLSEEIANAKDEAISSGETYTDASIAAIKEELTGYVKDEEAESTYATKDEMGSGDKSVLDAATAYADDVKNEMTENLSSHTKWMKDMLGERYLKKEDAADEYLTKNDADEIYETIKGHEASFSGFTTLEKHDALKVEVDKNTCDINHIYELLEAGPDTTKESYLVVKRAEYEELRNMVDELYNELKSLKNG